MAHVRSTGTAEPARTALAFLDGGGFMGDQIRRFDWFATPLGAPETWPVPLRTALRLLLTTNHPAFIFWGDGLTCFYNDAYARSLGPEQHPAILGRAGREVWQDIWPIIGPQIELVMRGAGATWNENQMVPITRFGAREEVYWTYSFGPIHDPDAAYEVGGVLVLCTETTSRVLEEARQREDATRWRSLFEQSPAFICVLRGPEHRFEYCNPRYQDLIGGDRVGIGRTVADVLPEVVSQGYVALLDAVFTTRKSHSANAARIVLAGVERFVDFVYQPIIADDGLVSGILVQGSDVTERELSQSRLNEASSRLQLATDAADIGIHEYDVQTGVLFWDQRVRRLWGIGADEQVTYDHFIDGVVPDDRAVTQAAVDWAMQPEHGGIYNAEYRVRDRSGTTRWVRATGRVEFDGGTAVRLVGTVQDITRQKLDEAALIEADRQKDVFLATLSHELRNPLAPIRSAAQVLAMPDVGAAEVRWVHDVITRQSQHMASLLEDLLDVARLTQGRMVLTREHLDIRTILDAAIETVQPALTVKRHTLHVNMPYGWLTVSGDAIRLCQVFTNLLSNAIKYMAAGGAIDIVAECDGDRAVVRVSDLGDGMAVDALSDVFGMFRQSSRTVEHAEGGLGIGLALVRAIVNLHGGSVHATSDGLGKGSTFIVELPLDRVTSGSTAARGDAPAPSPALPRRVLIADDNFDAADSLAMLLTMHGHTVQTARDGAETLRIAETFRPDVLLVDIGMPIMNGYEVARAIRDQAGHRGARLVALTGWGRDDDRERALAAGFDAHMTKPPDLKLLFEQLAL